MDHLKLATSLGLLFGLGCTPGSASSDSQTSTGADSGQEASSSVDGTTSTSAAEGSSDSTSAPQGTESADSESGSSGDASGTTMGEPWTGRLTEEQRVAFVHHYSPVIFKKAAETTGTAGRDWITNFDFDRDDWFLANNRDNWLDDLDEYLEGNRPSWRIRPTLYTAVLEFERDNVHSAVLLFHVYHAAQGDTLLENLVPEAGSIHDWERIEIRIDGVVGSPGSGESVTYVVITEHSDHVARLGSAPNLNFIDTDNGHHPMIFQAEHNDPLGVGFAELRFSETSAAELLAQSNAEVNVNGAEDQNFHYIFVGEGDEQLAAMFSAVPMTSCNAAALASGESNGQDMAEVPRIVYEHQDLADVFLSHWDDGSDNQSWQEPIVPILLADAMLDEAGIEEIPSGLQPFYAEALDDLDNDEDRRGYPRKHWFWGAYRWGSTGNFLGEAFRDGAPNGTRCVANGHPDCADNFFAQYDYFAHSGIPGDGTDDGEFGEWLPAGWHTEDAGGFDGRWAQVFDDALDRDCR